MRRFSSSRVRNETGMFLYLFGAFGDAENAHNPPSVDTAGKPQLMRIDGPKSLSLCTYTITFELWSSNRGQTSGIQKYVLLCTEKS